MSGLIRCENSNAPATTIRSMSASNIIPDLLQIDLSFLYNLVDMFILIAIVCLFIFFWFFHDDVS